LVDPNVLSMQLNHTCVFASCASLVATRGDHHDRGDLFGSLEFSKPID
jgi:hypothetical protein